MKKAVLGISSFLLIMLLLLILYTIHGRNIRQTELINSLDSAMRTSMEMLEKPKYAPKDQEEWIGQFLEAFVIQIDSSSDLTVHILEADVERGLLSVEAVLKFLHPIGTEGTVSARSTMLLENYGFSEQKPCYQIDYLVDDKNYKSYCLQQGENLIPPVCPSKTGKMFMGWRDREGRLISFGRITAEQDAVFTAQFSD